ncbi:unnamed protein product [Arabis nemorensis]|uniref:RRM domain-containing protein n=1 Tax=Arabis nemorensis TaxID=586526 RepID=A0A565CIZ8_9BRAS|nr:unnamed protein product [Arabis nemorensis]
MHQYSLDDNPPAIPSVSPICSQELPPPYIALMPFSDLAPVYISICVEGYDPSLCGEKLKCVLRKHFWRCGTLAIIRVPRVCTINRSFITFLGGRGRDTEKNALERNGSDMEGWNIVVTPFPYPNPIPELDAYRNPSKSCVKAEEDERQGGWIIVFAYGTSRTNDEDIKKSLIKHFSSCGEITSAYVVRSRKVNRVKVLIKGEGAVEKALKLTGCECSVKGCKLVAKEFPRSEVTGYTIQDPCFPVAKKVKV